MMVKYCSCGNYLFVVYVPKIRPHFICDKCNKEYIVTNEGQIKKISNEGLYIIPDKRRK